MRKLIFITSILALIGCSIASCNKEKEDVINSNNTQLKTVQFDHVEYINNLRAENKKSLDAFAADGLVLTFEKGEDESIVPILSFVEDQSHPGYLGWLIQEYNKFKNFCSSGPTEEELLQDCHMCKLYYFACPMGTSHYSTANIYRVDIIAGDLFSYRWNVYLEQTQGEPIDNGIKNMIKEAMYDVAYADARLHILNNKCNCE